MNCWAFWQGLSRVGGVIDAAQCWSSTEQQVLSTADVLASVVSARVCVNPCCHPGPVWEGWDSSAFPVIAPLGEKRTCDKPIDPYWQRDTKAMIKGARVQIERYFDQLEAEGSARRALLVVGNEPALDWLMDRWTNKPVALDRAELVCLVRAHGARWWQGRRPNGFRMLQLPRQWHMWWALTSGSGESIEALGVKIQSKMVVLTSPRRVYPCLAHRGASKRSPNSSVRRP